MKIVSLEDVSKEGDKFIEVKKQAVLFLVLFGLNIKPMNLNR
ncbi:MAG: hypothetical protein WCO53_03565 [Deltaproteobacteria bacterium]